jgi:putative transposase
MLSLKRSVKKRSKEEKEQILKECQKLGIVAGCRKNGIDPKQYYIWLERYQAHGIEGLEDRRSQNTEATMKRLEKENRALKELLADKELELKFKDELLKKKKMEWRRGKK